MQERDLPLNDSRTHPRFQLCLDFQLFYQSNFKKFLAISASSGMISLFSNRVIFFFQPCFKKGETLS